MSKGERLASRRRRPARETERHNRRALVLLAAAVACVVGVILALTLGGGSTPVLPNLVGQLQSRAETAVRTEGLKPNIIPNPDSKQCPPGALPRIISQYPEASKPAPKDKIVQLVSDCHV